MTSPRPPTGCGAPGGTGPTDSPSAEASSRVGAAGVLHDAWGRPLWCYCGNRLHHGGRRGRPSLYCSRSCAQRAHAEQWKQAKRDAARLAAPTCSTCGTRHDVPPRGGCAKWDAGEHPAEVAE